MTTTTLVHCACSVQKEIQAKAVSAVKLTITVNWSISEVDQKRINSLCHLKSVSKCPCGSVPHYLHKNDQLIGPFEGAASLGLWQWHENNKLMVGWRARVTGRRKRETESNKDNSFRTLQYKKSLCVHRQHYRQANIVIPGTEHMDGNKENYPGLYFIII